MAWSCLLWLTISLALLSSPANAAIVQQTFRVGNLTVNRLCQSRVITAVNGQLPGPTIQVNEGDTVVVHVLNESPYNMTIHWHGVFQRLSPWADGPDYVTQCPILPGNSYTYQFTINGQEGTLWWHAHVSWLRATVYGALIIRPKAGIGAYPFPTPYQEIPIILGEWYNANVVDVINTALATGGAPNISNAFTINGQPGDLYSCSSNHTYKLEVVQGKTYMLRIINAALNNQLFFKIAGHNLTIVAADASYTTQYNTNVVVLAPGQTIDALMVSNAPPGYYYMAASPYSSGVGVVFDNTITTAIVQYTSAIPSSVPPLLPVMPTFNDTPTAHRFYSNLTSLLRPGHPTVPLEVDERMFVTIGLNLIRCGSNTTCQGPFGEAFAASMNNISFQLPSTVSLLEAHFKHLPGIYTSDFPNNPPVSFDYTNTNLSFNMTLLPTVKATRLKQVKYNTVVEMVMQDTALVGIENHPMHLHGYDFFVLAQGFGNYNSTTAVQSFNLVNPQLRNTIAVPVGGWAVIRFVANNPGVWMMHCHLDGHLSWGLAMAFEVQNGYTPSSIIPPPPPDFPKC